MKKKLSSRHIIIIVLSVLILVLVGVAYSKSDERKLNPVEKFIKDTVINIEKIVYTPINFIVDTINSYQELLTLYDEYKVLKNEFNKSSFIFAQNQELKKELDELKKILKLNDLMTEYEILNASVVIRNVNVWNNVLIIDKGAFHGIKNDMAVINHQGLIGRIANVSEFTSEVKLITSHDLQNKISVTIQSGEESIYGLVNGYLAKENLLKVEGVPSNYNIKHGSMVYTSGLGGIFPKGILVGTVEKSTKDSVDLTQIVEIKPAANFNDIRFVTVIKREAIK